MITLSNKAMLEISDLSFRAQKLARGSAADRAESTVLTQRISTIRQQGISSDEMRARYATAVLEDASQKPSEAEYRNRFLKYVTGEKKEIETRDLLAGTASITYTQGSSGGYTVPFDMQKLIFEAVAQTTPLLSPTVCHFEMEPTPTLQPQQIAGYDLSTVTATLIAESAQQTAQVIPTVTGKILRANLIFKASFAASWEAEQDIPDTVEKFSRVIGVAFSRTLGQYATTGTGSATQPQGVFTSIPSSVYSTGTGKITLTDIDNIYFSVNRIYRSQPKCAWLMHDSVYQRVRAAVDNSGRPLLNVRDDREVLFGKPVYISPDLPAVGGSPAQNGAILFGDFDHFHVRVSTPTLQRTTQQAGSDITKGECLFVARIRMDSQLFDPSNNVTPPLVWAVVTV